MYKVTIEKIVEVTKKTKREYTTIAETLFDPEEIAKQRVSLHQDAQIPVKKIYGYTPEIEEQVMEETKIYEQRLESLDLPQVILAINGLFYTKNLADQ